ncbi:YifB family Mg chelatase-like AAA ATPase [Actinocorallia sp. A-T 12471]|uniref:YifB family Mg chelatase-like AAA ATPase n=1 Tax=Actinocorallia sp. A-T 12471 TaxID=3089813 RepID=UPI0029CADF71|nr:YifB family Mg chelatase-like AAA ATPase [Actinocorallia sp. A-T 12471]MDX6739129.1 YifB family Mg chelatase-like AAA ATPase [Actinocorallia sp. A-T 12471]
MALARTRSVGLIGVRGHLVDVEAAITNGTPGLHLVGLPDTALSEARDRVRAAILHSGEDWPTRHMTVALGPADLPKAGAGFDLAIAVAILAAAGVLPVAACAEPVMIGELGLDGRVRAVRGALPAVLGAAEAGFRTVVVPLANREEAELVPGVRVLAVPSLRALLCELRGEPVPEEPERPAEPPPYTPVDSARTRRGTLDLADVRGQSEGRRALEISAAGGHHLFLLGPPGCGKTMLAERLPSLLPPLERQTALEVTAIHSVAGTLPPGQPLVAHPPFHAPHHTASRAAMIGGGSGRRVRPGAISLAHAGVLFVDEAPEFQGGVLDSMRQPMEQGEVCIDRTAFTVKFPALFTLVMAANPCPCAAAKVLQCRCTPAIRSRYLSRISGPLLDRVDLKLELSPATRAELRYDLEAAESSATVSARVLEARERALKRMAGLPWRTNSEVPGPELRRSFAPPPESLVPLELALQDGSLSARGMDRALRTAWTIADLAGRDSPAPWDTAEALAFWQGHTT